MRQVVRHPWKVSVARAIAIQEALRGQVRAVRLRRPARWIAGGDCAPAEGGARMVAGWVVWDLELGRVVEEKVAVCRTSFPYVPGLLSFREAPALLGAARKLRSRPDVFMLDGQGRAHPRRFGLACHVGLLLGRPSMGCGKSRLCGTHAMPGPVRGAWCPLKEDGEEIGRVLRTRDGVRPIYVSVGHLLALDDAVSLALSCTGRFRVPEPTRLADQLVGRWRDELAGSQGRPAG
jgi:deoxyribonuclease V